MLYYSSLVQCLINNGGLASHFLYQNSKGCHANYLVFFRGETTGKSFKIGNYDAYLATPKDTNNHQGAGILYLSDVFGIWTNSQLLADQYAANGYTTLIIDILNGDGLTEIPAHNFDWMKWLMGGFRNESTPHTNEYVDPAVEEAIKYMRNELNITAIGAVGYCFGAKVT